MVLTDFVYTAIGEENYGEVLHDVFTIVAVVSKGFVLVWAVVVSAFGFATVSGLRKSFIG